MKAILLVALVLGLVASVLGDCYMQYPPGSNNRNREANTNRNNANHLFDSQNNGKGGYCRGPQMKYYEGSLLQVAWTSQHGCGGHPNLVCNVVLQYICGPADAPLQTRIRDGTTTDTIPETLEAVLQTDANGEATYALHETFEYYQTCEQRERNMGLFIADRKEEGGLTPGRRDARYTRQDNNVNRYGFECQEESEYYPYWAPSPWKDVAIFAHDQKFCGFYKSESENIKGRGYCEDTDNNGQTGNNEVGCTANGDTWKQAPSHGIPPPDCLTMPVNADNHLGNNMMGGFNTYEWKLPSANQEECIKSDAGCNCVLRIRYNISTGDVGPDGNNPDKGFIDSRSNDDNSPIKDDETKLQDGLGHSLALDTTQFGRTFQDRSHVFSIIKRPSSLTGKIWNLNVQGKRGNIVQAYPATEYDFVPRELHVLTGDHIHFQWTGCDKNPAGNAGEGTDQTDRSNFVQLECSECNHPATDDWIQANPGKVLFRDVEVRKRMAYLDQEKSGLCLTYEELAAKNNNNNNQIEQDVQNCMKMNAAEPYFDGGAIKMNNVGTYHYMSTRNNNFSNRSQKGIITVDNALPVWGIAIVVVGAAVFVAATAVGAATWYSRSHPHSGVANFVQRMG